MGNIKLICADADGTLISNGNLKEINPSLKKVINYARDEGILFSIDSGRDFITLQNLFSSITNSFLKSREALLYEDVGFFVNKEHQVFGGVEKKLLEKIRDLPLINSGLFTGLVPLPDNKFQYRTAWVTKEFAQNQSTNIAVLQKGYIRIKEFIEREYPNLEVKKSADGIDVVARGVDKKIPFQNYLDLLNKVYNIFPKEILVIGDAENDLGMINHILEKGGKAGFVGNEEILTEDMKSSSNFYLSDLKGPKGTTELINKYIL